MQLLTKSHTGVEMSMENLGSFLVEQVFFNELDISREEDRWGFWDRSNKFVEPLTPGIGFVFHGGSFKLRGESPHIEVHLTFDEDLVEQTFHTPTPSEF